MATVVQTSATNGVRLSALSPKYLHTNSTSHTWPFSAIAELIDNAYDPDVDASQLWIDVKRYKTLSGHCLIFADNGAGMNPEKLYKMLSFGFCEKVAKKGHMPVGHYGNGFKSGSMRLGKDAIVFTKDGQTKSVGFLSQTYLELIHAESILVPIATWDSSGKLLEKSDGDKALDDILKYSLWKSMDELMKEFDEIASDTGTRIIIFRTRKTNDGKSEFDFITDPTDIRIPDDSDQELLKLKKQQRQNHIPESDYSLRAYCAILYLKPRMQIILRGKKVRTMVIAKSLSKTEVDTYRPQHMNKSVKITFGFSQNKNHYGIMMYHRNRLIKPYVRVGFQLKANNLGVGVVGVIECDFLQPTHNKQDFDYTKMYRACMSSLGTKLNEYWNEKKGPNRGNSQAIPEVPIEVQSLPDQVWVQCDNPACLKWRKLPMGTNSEDLPDKWYCKDNPDKNFRSCDVPEEKEDETRVSAQPYIKTQKRRLEREMEERKKKEKEMKLAKERQQVEEARKLELKKAELQKKEEELQRRIRELQNVRNNEAGIMRKIETQSTRQKTQLQQQYKFHPVKTENNPKLQVRVAPVASTPRVAPKPAVPGAAVRLVVASTPQSSAGSSPTKPATSTRPQLVRIAPPASRTLPGNQQPGIKVVNVVGTPGTYAKLPSQPATTRTVVALSNPTATQQVLPKVVSVQSMSTARTPISLNGQSEVGVQQTLMPKVLSVHSAQTPAGPVLAPKQVAQVRAVPVSGQLVMNTRSPTTTGPVRIVATTTVPTGQPPRTPTVTSLASAPEPSSPFTPSPTAADAELGRQQVTVNERFRFIAPTVQQSSGKSSASSARVSQMLASAVNQSASLRTSPPAPSGICQVKVKQEPTALQQLGAMTVAQSSPPQPTSSPTTVSPPSSQAVTPTVRVKQEVMDEEPSETATLNGKKRRHDDECSPTVEPPRQKPKISDKDVIVIDPPSPPAVDKSPVSEAPTPLPNGDANSPEGQKTNVVKEDIGMVVRISKMDAQERLTELVKATKNLRSLRANVCKLLRLLVPELELDGDKEEILDDTTVDDLLEQVLAANMQL